MRKDIRMAALCTGAMIVFCAGFAAGQQSAPHGDHMVQQTLLATIDLATALARPGERELRLSRVTVAPHGHIGLHSHEDDPTVVYVVSGVLTNRHDGTTNEVRAGEAFAEFGPKSHWVENAASTPATFVFASVSRRQ